VIVVVVVVTVVVAVAVVVVAVVVDGDFRGMLWDVSVLWRGENVGG
jgi:hypothetical protein